MLFIVSLLSLDLHQRLLPFHAKDSGNVKNGAKKKKKKWMQPLVVRILLPLKIKETLNNAKTTEL